MKRTKYIPAIVTLIGCLAASVIAIINRYDALDSMITILSVLVGFYIAGLIIKGFADKYLVIEEEKNAAEETPEDGEEAAENAEADSENRDAGKEEKVKEE